jgi:hypothetical protein
MEDYVLTDEEQLIVDQGADARSLLLSDIFIRTIGKLKADCAQSILESSPEQSQERERTYYMARALEAVVNELETISNAGDAIMTKLAFLTETPTDTESQALYAPDSTDSWY